MNVTPPRVRPYIVLLLTALTLTVGCARRSTPPAPEIVNENVATESGARNYVVRARVVQIHLRARPSQIDIEHEAVPDLIGPGGEVEGMHSMVMPFPVAEGVDLSSLAEDDLIEVDLRVDWEASLPAVITAIRHLPATTELDLG